MKSLLTVRKYGQCVPAQLRRLLLLAVMMQSILADVSAQTDVDDNERAFTLRIKNHLFDPAQLIVPANTRFRLLIINEDKTAEEFESASLNREKVIMGESEGTIFLGPLAPGEYSFFGEFNPRTANGKLIVVIPQKAGKS
ncbi:MAG: cupredoxin domain-containing protein [Pseudohongiella sp.]|nr:cupredoxin domain-containing protein [Pseudohongiella sp.]